MIRFIKLTVVGLAISSSAAFAAAPGTVTAAVGAACCALGVCCGMPCCG